MNRSPRADLWDLAWLAEDYFRGGFRRDHPQLAEAAGESRAAESDAGDSLTLVAEQVQGCVKCPLSAGRTLAVPGEGAERPLVVVVGEGPGAEEDRTGRPFVGPAGRYLDEWLSAVGLSRESNAFIANIVKCRPPGNRDPLPVETRACMGYLQRQIRLLSPRVILTVGRIAAQILLGASTGIGALRGKVYTWEGIPLVPTYHPSAVLRDQSLRRPVWDDLKRLRTLLPDE